MHVTLRAQRIEVDRVALNGASHCASGEASAVARALRRSSPPNAAGRQRDQRRVALARRDRLRACETWIRYDVPPVSVQSTCRTFKFM